MLVRQTARANGVTVCALCAPAYGLHLTCAELGAIALTPETGRTGEASGTVWCGVRSNLAGGTPASNQSAERVAVATFLAWHVQARNLIQYAQHPAVGPVADGGES
jgi:hypothetical protein